jgi:molecular chaperone GrpE
MGDEIQWHQLYDAVSAHYQSVETMLKESQRTLARTEEAVGESTRKKLLLKVCDLGDNLFHLVGSIEKSSHNGAIHEGAMLIIQAFLELLKSENVALVNVSGGDKFDPQFHEAVNAVPSKEIAQGCVVEELRKGYTYRTALLRAARVTVSSGKPQF